MDSATTRTALSSENDFALDVPGFHEELARLRQEHPVAYVPFHGGTAYMLTSYHDVERAFLDEATMPAEAACVSALRMKIELTVSRRLINSLLSSQIRAGRKDAVGSSQRAHRPPTDGGNFARCSQWGSHCWELPTGGDCQ